MPLFTIRREVPGADRTEIDAAAFRAIVCAYEYPGLRWVRSYWDAEAGELSCLYEAESAQQIEEHSRRSRIPCDAVREVIQFGPEEYAQIAGPPPESDRRRNVVRAP
jgi:hypothetical protein